MRYEVNIKPASDPSDNGKFITVEARDARDATKKARAVVYGAAYYAPNEALNATITERNF
jgi:hypothetical protein